MLTWLLAVPTKSPLPWATLVPLNLMSPLYRLILTHLTIHVDELAQQVTVELRDTADVELQEQLDDHRFEFAALLEDSLMEINRLCDAKL